MKKFLSVVFAVIMVFSLAACSDAQPNDVNQTSTVKEAVEILNQVWEAYSEDELFPAAGGDYNHSVMDQPGKFDISDAESMQSIFYVPQESLALIDDAASLMHMMNANTFTGGVFHVVNADDLETLSSSMKDSILNTQWMCGFPDVLLLVQVENNYLVSVFGDAELVETFKTKLMDEFNNAKIFAEEDLNS